VKQVASLERLVVMVAQKHRMGSHKEAWGPHGVLSGTDAELAKHEAELVKNGYTVEYFLLRGRRQLHYQKEGLYDAITERANGGKLGGAKALAEGVSPAVYG